MDPNFIVPRPSVSPVSDIGLGLCTERYVLAPALDVPIQVVVYASKPVRAVESSVLAEFHLLELYSKVK